MREKISDGFCVLPFYGIEYPNKTPCCLLKKNYDLGQIRLDMLANKKPSACKSCWSLESQNLVSDRQLKNSSVDYIWDRDIRAIEDDCHDGKFYINHYKIDISNICNAACVTCDRSLSSYWGSLEKSFFLKEISKQELDIMIDYHTAIVINFRGGESLLAKSCFYVIEKLLEVGNTRCNLQFTTNGSIKLNKNQTALLKQFQNVNFGVSIDGTHNVFEYMRYPLKWNDINENINHLQEIGHVSATPTLSNINLLYFSNLIRWFENNSLNYNFNLVNEPSWFAPNVLPLKVKKAILENEPHPVVVNCLTSHTVDNDINFEKALEEIARQDALKKIDIRTYLPEFCKLAGI